MITSTRNPKIQRLRLLLGRSKERQKSGAFVVEGVRLVEEALQARWMPMIVLYTGELNERGQRIVAQFSTSGVETEQVTPSVLDSLSDTESPQGIFAVLPIRQLPLPAHPDFLIVADAIHDPGNLGTLLRTAGAAGAQAVLVMPGTVDPYSPKVVRSAMGAHFRLPLAPARWEDLSDLARSQGLHIYLTDAGHGKDLWQADLRQPLALIIGSEAEGASSPARLLAGTSLRIPMPGQTESLNASIAGAIVMFEVVRQRSAETAQATGASTTAHVT